MKFLLVLLVALVVSLVSLSEALSHPVDSQLSTIDRHDENVKMYLEKRKSKKNNKKKNKDKKKYDHNCKSRKCALILKPCPKDCPMSCGYIDSPDPCCPLLGKPTCPDY